MAEAEHLVKNASKTYQSVQKKIGKVVCWGGGDTAMHSTSVALEIRLV